MVALVWAFSLIVGAAGWFYLFYSRAAINMAGVEPHEDNRRRIGLRRLGGVAMILLAVAFVAGAISVDPGKSPRAFVAIWVMVVALLGMILVLGLMDLRLTWKIRKRKQEERQ